MNYTETITDNAGRTVQHTAFTNGDHTLHRYATAGGRVDYEIESTGDVTLNLRINWNNETTPVTVTVSWPSIGAVTPARAYAFADAIVAANEAAADFTARILHY